MSRIVPRPLPVAPLPTPPAGSIPLNAIQIDGCEQGLEILYAKRAKLDLEIAQMTARLITLRGLARQQLAMNEDALARLAQERDDALRQAETAALTIESERDRRILAEEGVP